MKKLLCLIPTCTILVACNNSQSWIENPDIIKPVDVNSQGQDTVALSDVELATKASLAMYNELAFDDCKIYFDNIIFKDYSSNGTSPGEVSMDRLTLRGFCEMQNSHIWELENWDDQDIVTSIGNVNVNDSTSTVKSITVEVKISQTKYKSNTELAKTFIGCFDDGLIIEKRTYGWIVSQYIQGIEKECTW